LFSKRSLGLVGEADASTHLLQSKALGLIGYTPTSFEAISKWIHLFQKGCRCHFNLQFLLHSLCTIPHSFLSRYLDWAKASTLAGCKIHVTFAIISVSNILHKMLCWNVRCN
jgi:hypothetical protein